MVNVVTNENIAQLIETGKVDPYVPPVAEKPQDAPKEEIKPEVKAEVTPETKIEAEKPDDDSDELGDLKLDDAAQKRINARINKKHAQMKEAEEFAELQYNEKKLAEKRAENAEARLKELEAKVQPPPEETVVKPKPTPDQFKDAFEYAEALADWKVEQKFEAKVKEETEAKQKAERERIDSEFATRVTEIMKEFPDYREVVGAASDIIMPPYITQFLLESTSGPRLCWHFAKNKSEFERINKLSPIKAIAELGKLETKLEKPAAKEAAAVTATAKTEITRAPAPIQPIDGSSTPVVKDPAKMNFKELREYERQRAAERRRH
jgi:hypothetical protein